MQPASLSPALYRGRRLLTAETAELNPETLKGLQPGGDSPASADKASTQTPGQTPALSRLSDAEVSELGEWLIATLPTRLSKVRTMMM